MAHHSSTSTLIWVCVVFSCSFQVLLLVLQPKTNRSESPERFYLQVSSAKNWSLEAVRPSHEASVYAWASQERIEASTADAAAQLERSDLDAVAAADASGEWRKSFGMRPLALVAPPDYLGDRASSYGAGLRLRLAIESDSALDAPKDSKFFHIILQVLLYL